MTTKKNANKNGGQKKGNNKSSQKSGKGKGISKTQMAVVGAGLATIGAGAYYLMGPGAKTHQKRAKNLVAQVKKGVKRELKNVKIELVPGRTPLNSGNSKSPKKGSKNK